MITQNHTKVEFKEKVITIEKIVPQIIERTVQIEKLMYSYDADQKTKLLEEERALIRREVRIEF